MINYTFLKSPCEFKYAKIFAKLSKTKTENVQILFKGICAKIYLKISSQKLCNLLSLVQGFPKSYKKSKSYNWKYV